MVIIWLFDKRGFISVVAYDPTKDKEPKSPFRDIAKKAGTHVLVRARIEADLDFLKTVVPNLVVDTQPSADYSFRAVISRKQYKRILAEAVDGITYDSHFKEAARDASPPATGRYNAMMNVWSDMASLQPYIPYSGYSTGYYGTTNKAKTTTTSSWTSTTRSSTSLLPNGKMEPVDSVQDFVDRHSETKGKFSFKGGHGPKRGFKTDDRVEGWFGVGTVVSVDSRDDFDMVKVQPDVKSKGIASYMSTYLQPANLTVYPEVEVTKVADPVAAARALASEPTAAELDAIETGVTPDKWDENWLYGELVEDPRVFNFDAVYDFDMMTDNAYSLLTRCQTWCNASNVESIPVDILDELFNEIEWEYGNESDRIKLIADDMVPEKHKDEAIRLANENIAALHAG